MRNMSLTYILWIPLELVDEDTESPSFFFWVSSIKEMRILLRYNVVSKIVKKKKIQSIKRTRF